MDVVLDRGMGNTGGYDDVPPGQLLQECVHVRERGAIGEVGEPLRAYDLVELGLRLPLDVGVERYCEEERCDG